MRETRFALFVSVLLASNVFADADAAVEMPAGPTADQAYRQLLDGQMRFATDTRTLPHQGELRRCETTTNGQHPIAAVLTCADSRVPPEMLFDQGLGDLFVIRVAGNVAAADELGTLEYGVAHLKIPLIVVLGHSRCGAVTAVVDGAHAEGNLAQLLKPIAPAAERARHDHASLRGPALVSAAIQENVRQAMHDLTANSPVIAKAVEAGGVKIVGGVYDIHSGRIDWLGEPGLAAVEPVKAAPAHAATHAAAPVHDAHAPSAAAHASDPAAHFAGPVTPQKAHADDHAPAAQPSEKRPAVDAHGAPAAPMAIDPHAKSSPATPDAHAVVPAKFTENYYLLAGMLGASTLIGAGIARFAPGQHA